jgi:hypothetical protein
MQVPRNDFSVLIYGRELGEINKVLLIPKDEACKDHANDELDSTHSGARNVSAFNLVSGPYVATFEWSGKGCVPTSHGVQGQIWSDEGCPQEGWYRLCYMTAGDGAGNTTNVLAYVQQAHVTITSVTIQPSVSYETNTPFTLAVQLVDANGLPCCFGTKVLLNLRNNGADYSSYMYNAAGSNSPFHKIATAGRDGMATFTDFTIRSIVGANFYFTASVPGNSVNIPPNVDGVQGYFHVSPNRLIVTTQLASEYIVSSAVTLPSAITVRAEDKHGNLVMGLNTSDGLHCEVQLQTGGFGTDSAVNVNKAGVGNTSTTPDLQPIGVQNGGADRPLFQNGIAVVKNLTILNQAGR